MTSAFLDIEPGGLRRRTDFQPTEMAYSVNADLRACARLADSSKSFTAAISSSNVSGKRTLVVNRTNPCRNVGHSDRDAVFAILECRRAPFFLYSAFAANRSGLFFHKLSLLSLAPPERRTFP